MNNKVCKNNKSLALIEVLLAVGALIIIVLAFVSFSKPAFLYSRTNLAKLQAREYVQDAMEKIRNIRDTNLKNGDDFNNGIQQGDVMVTDCPPPSASGQAFCIDHDSSLETIGDFHRYVKIDEVGNDTYKITVEVKWGDSFENSIKAVSYLTDWKG